MSSPIYFMTEDDVTRGLTEVNILTGAAFDPVPPPINIESVLATLPTGDGGAPELWKLNHYYERLDDWYAPRVWRGTRSWVRPQSPTGNSTI